MSGIGALVFLVLLGLILGGSRRTVVMALMGGVLYLSEAHPLQIGPINIFGIRLLELAAFLRMVLRNEFDFSRLTRSDLVLLGVYGYATVIFLVRSREGIGSAIAVALEALFCYFVFRAMIRNVEEFRWYLRTLVLILIPYLAMLFIERRTGRIPLTFMAGGAGMEGGFVRDGVPRCFGSFRNMDLLGSFGASCLPLYMSLLPSKPDRGWAVLGCLFSLLIVIFSNSGGPLGATGVCFVGWGMWVARRNMKAFRIATLAALTLLALVMKAPIWYLLDRASSFTGGSGWHRSYLIDVAYRHLDQWWVWGMSMADTRDWFPYILGATGGADITNQYLVFGLNAGLIAMVLLALLLASAYSRLGRALAITRVAGLTEAERILWALGVALTVHAFSWLGISYYDQIHVVWFLHLAVIATFSEGLIREAAARGLNLSGNAEGSPPAVEEENLQTTLSRVSEWAEAGGTEVKGGSDRACACLVALCRAPALSARLRLGAATVGQ